MTKRTTKKYARKSRKTNKTSKRVKRVKGGCGCANNTLKLPFSGGGLPTHTFYPVNTYANDPQATLINTRNLPNISSVGGRKYKRTRRLRKKIRGGMAPFDAVSSGLNPTSFVSAYNLMRLDSGVDSSITSQPIKAYSVDNPPLI